MKTFLLVEVSLCVLDWLACLVECFVAVTAVEAAILVLCEEAALALWTFLALWFN